MAARTTAVTPTRKTVVVNMTRTKETKNTFKFEADLDTAPVSTVYVNKTEFTGPVPPVGVRVTVEVLD